MDIERVKELVEELKQDHLSHIHSDPEETVTETLWNQLERQLKGTGEHWAFHIEMFDNQQQRSGNIEQAFTEFFEAHQAWEKKKPSPYAHSHSHSDTEEFIRENPEPGTKNSPFIASNGITIRYR